MKVGVSDVTIVGVPEPDTAGDTAGSSTASITGGVFVTKWKPAADSTDSCASPKR